MDSTTDPATFATGTEPSGDYDVIVVGAGPVGQLAAILLARRGRRVAVIERWPNRFPQPRACGIGHEPVRIIQAAGLGERIAPMLEFVIGPDRPYHFTNAAGDILLAIAWNQPGESGWPEMSTFFQPELEEAFETLLLELPEAEVHRGWAVTAVTQNADGVEVTIAPSDAEGRGIAGRERSLTGRYVIGADGANSMVRDAIGSPMGDLGFAYDWLVVDVLPHTERDFQPYLEQRCDPARPTTSVPSGPGRRRWEFMVLPGETKEELNSAQAAWRLLEPWDVRPENATLVRHAVYTFNGRWAEQWRSGRFLLVGDSAHLMPPFLGQGMGSGFRDVMGLAWRLDLVLAGEADPGLLDSYGPERLGHVRDIIDEAVGLGHVICVTDPKEAAVRDKEMIAALTDPSLAPPPSAPWRLGASPLVVGDGLPGRLCVQGRVAHGGSEGLFDDVVGSGFVLLSPSGDPAAYLGPEAGRVWQRLGGISAHVAPGAQIDDLDGTYAEWFARHEVDLVLARPDFYIVDSGDLTDADRLVRALGDALQLTP